MIAYRGMTALVTGASAGIGAVYADALAARGANLVLVARSEDKLGELAARLRDRYGVEVAVIAADLSREHAAREVAAAVAERGLRIDILLNNAAAATPGRFVEIEPETAHRDVMLNMVALVDLTALLLPAMVARRSGAVINLASTAAYQPVPYMAVYAATKAFVLSFSEALWAENKRHGVRVLTVCPGATETAMSAGVGRVSPAAVKNAGTPQAVVDASLRALESGSRTVIPGAGNFWMAQFARMLPRRGVLPLVERMMRPKPRTA